MKQQINLDHSDILSAVEQYVASRFPEFAEKDVRCKLYLDGWNRVIAVATVEDVPKDDGKTEEV
jgi:hypothetical protein